jgi:hypothetical protein
LAINTSVPSGNVETWSVAVPEFNAAVPSEAIPL